MEIKLELYLNCLLYRTVRSSVCLSVHPSVKSAWLVCKFQVNLVADVQVTVNSEIFARILFSRNFAYAKFRENKTLVKWRNH